MIVDNMDKFFIWFMGYFKFDMFIIFIFKGIYCFCSNI